MKNNMKKKVLDIAQMGGSIELTNTQDYDIEMKNSTIILTRKKKFPTTYEECCKVLNVDPKHTLGFVDQLFDTPNETEGSLLEDLNDLYKLLICRNAYWKLDNNWKPDYSLNNNMMKYSIELEGRTDLEVTEYYDVHRKFSFSSEEIAEEFKSNFMCELRRALRCN